MLTHPRRLISTALAIVMGVAFVAAALALGATLNHTMEQDAAGTVRNATIVVSPGSGDLDSAPVPPAYADRLRTLPGVTATHPDITATFRQDRGASHLPLAAISLQTDDADRLTSGRLPTTAGEVAVTTSLAESRSVGVGQDLTFSSGENQQTRVRVVGILEPARSLDPRQPAIVADAAHILAWSHAPGYDSVTVTAPAAEPGRLARQARDLPGAAGLTIRTAQEETDARVADATRGTGAVTGLVLSFAAVAVLVSAIVIANTFSILIAQRVRELALLRAVGATRAQVFRSVVTEAVALAVVASAIGLALGLGLVAGLAAFSQTTGFALAGLSVDVWTLVVPLIVGIVVTVVATVVPARRATRVAPVAALRPDLSTPTGTRAGKVRTAVGVVLVAGGTALVWYGAAMHQLVLGLAGGALSVVGVLMLATIVVPALAGLIGILPARVGGLPAQLAVDNARRNPARAASTASALFIGVTLITLMSVGAATTQASVNLQLDRSLPVDLAIGGGDATTMTKALNDTRTVPQVQAATQTFFGQAAVNGSDEHLTLLGLGPDSSQVVRDPRLSAGLADDTVLLNPKAGYPDGATLTVRSGRPVAPGTVQQVVTLRAVVRDDVGDTAMTTAATVRRIDPAAQTGIWVRFRDGADAARATEAVNQALSAHSGLEVSDAVTRRAAIDQAVQLMLYIVTGLLGVAVLIALVGVGNTLALSVLERTRENGLLRALGVTRRQIRGMLGTEALILAGVGVVLGVGLGIGYGLAGAHALVGADAEIVPTVPWWRLLTVAAVALGAGWLASVLPGRQAAKVSPSTALTAE